MNQQLLLWVYTQKNCIHIYNSQKVKAAKVPIDG